jgi:hypothetical protein
VPLNELLFGGFSVGGKKGLKHESVLKYTNIRETGNRLRIIVFIIISYEKEFRSWNEKPLKKIYLKVLTSDSGMNYG